MCLSTKATSNNELSNNRQKNFFSYFECLSKRKKRKKKTFVLFVQFVLIQFWQYSIMCIEYSFWIFLCLFLFVFGSLLINLMFVRCVTTASCISFRLRIVVSKRLTIVRSETPFHQNYYHIETSQLIYIALFNKESLTYYSPVKTLCFPILRRKLFFCLI